MSQHLAGLRRVVLDVLKPHFPQIHEMAVKLNQVRGVEGVNISLVEVDQNTESVKVTVEGAGIDFEELGKRITELGGVIHSVDEVVAGKKIVEKVTTYRGE